MITRKEEGKIHILSDTELYPQAVRFMRSINQRLPPTQINGLVNISFSNTYKQIADFAAFQYTRSTWKTSEHHIPDFYRRFAQELKVLEKRARTLLAAREEAVTQEDQEEVTLALVREFLQHLLAENYYMMATHAFQPAEPARIPPGKQAQPHRDRRNV